MLGLRLRVPDVLRFSTKNSTNDRIISICGDLLVRFAVLPTACRKWPKMLRTYNFESLKPAAFVFGNIDIAFGIHGGTNSIKELALEEKPRAVADR